MIENMESGESLINLQTMQIPDVSFSIDETESFYDHPHSDGSEEVRKIENEQCGNDFHVNIETSAVTKTEGSNKCQECGKEFKTEFWLKKHLHKHSFKQRFECDLCGKIFKHNSVLRAHHREVHSETKKYSCAQCSYTTNNKTNYKTHVKIRHLDVNKNGIKCDSCDKKFFRKEDMIRHKIKEHNAPRFKCDTCDKSYTSRQYLLIHKVSHQSDFKLEHQCVECGKMFPNGGQLSSHIRRKHLSPQYSCQDCGKSVSSPACLRDHMTQHSGVKSYACQVCGKTFATRKYLNIHTRTHTGEKPYSCLKCDKTFTQKSSLSVHNRRFHTDVKPFLCNVCLKGFVTSTLLKNHMTVHEKMESHLSS